MEPALVGTSGFEMHHDRHRHPLRWRLVKSNVGENFILDGVVEGGVSSRLSQRNLADFSHGVGPDSDLNIHNGGSGLFMGSQDFNDAALHLSGVIPVLAATTTPFSSKASTPAAAIASGETRGIIALDAGGKRRRARR